MPGLSRAEEARARLAAVRASPPAPRPEEEESLLNYAGRRLQLAAMPAVALSEKDLLSVYEPSDDTFLLLDALEADRSLLRAVSPALCIELGCGSGVVLSALAKMMLAGGGGGGCGGGGGGCCRCVGTDINAAALGVARRTAALNGVGTIVELVQGDLLSCFRRFQFRSTPSLYDVLVFNPPYVPSEPDEIGLDCSWAPKISAAWAVCRNSSPPLFAPLAKMVGCSFAQP
jgi:methylase of polypeptide subunit release factors